MREHYHEQLEAISKDLVELTHSIESAMSRATGALVSADLQAAEAVVAEDAAIDQAALAIETACASVIALQAPVASELRFLIGALRMSSTLERMGDLAAHIAKQVVLRHPAQPIPADLRATFSMMGAIATSVVQKTAAVIELRDLNRAADVAVADEQMDELHRELFEVVLSPSWAHGVEAAIDVTLLSRFYERFADHGVTIARRVAYIVTGDMPTKSELAENA